MNINIIGNGFDLYHGLPSSYYYFGCYLIEKDFEFYERFCNAYNIFSKISIGPSICHDFEFGVENMFWRDFESHLGEVYDNFVIDTTEDDLNLENDDPVEIEVDNDSMADELKKYFVQWVRETLDTECNYNVIRRHMNIGSNKLDLNNQDIFLVFNYTHVLQNIYEIDDYNIHYVHGECLDDDSELIVGHGNTTRIEEIEEEIKELENSYSYSQGELNRINENKSLVRFLSKLKKDVALYNSLCIEFYSKFSENIEVINVYGMSLGNVDMPYLEYLRYKWKNAYWRFSYFSQQDIEQINYVAKEFLNLSEGEFEIFEFENTESNEIMQTLITENNIIEYEKIKA